MWSGGKAERKKRRVGRRSGNRELGGDGSAGRGRGEWDAGTMRACGQGLDGAAGGRNEMKGSGSVGQGMG
jgi:hypothetical protein